MKKIIFIALLKLKLIFKDKPAAISMFLAPMIFVTVLVLGFGSGGNSTAEARYPVGLVNNDHGAYSKQLLSMINKDNTFKIVECRYNDLEGYLMDGKIAMGIVIKDKFSEAIENNKDGQLEVVKLQNNETTIALAAVINNYVYQLKVGNGAGKAAADILLKSNRISREQAAGAENKVESQFMKNLKTPKIAFEAQKVLNNKKNGLDYMSYSAIGIIIMFLMFFVTRGAGSILEEKEQGTWNKVQSTPTGSSSVMAGYVLGNLMIGWIQVGTLILVSRYVFRINWGNSPLALVILFTAFLLAVIGLGTALASLVKTKSQLSSLSPIIVIPTSLLAGCMWPREVMSETMLAISNYVPQTWVIKGMMDLVARGSDISSVIVPSAILMLFAAVFFIIGLTLMGIQNKATV